MVTRTTDIDHPDRNCVSRVCDRCGKVYHRVHHESPSFLDDVERKQRENQKVMLEHRLADLCRKCTEESNANQKA